MSFMITCPICGKRDGYEFRFGGEDCGPRPAETDLTSDRWLDDVGCGLQFGATPSPIWKLISREQTHDQTH
jgi:hypothetical protein